MNAALTSLSIATKLCSAVAWPPEDSLEECSRLCKAGVRRNCVLQHVEYEAWVAEQLEL